MKCNTIFLCMCSFLVILFLTTLCVYTAHVHTLSSAGSLDFSQWTSDSEREDDLKVTFMQSLLASTKEPNTVVSNITLAPSTYGNGTQFIFQMEYPGPEAGENAGVRAYNVMVHPLVLR